MSELKSQQLEGELKRSYQLLSWLGAAALITGITVVLILSYQANSMTSVTTPRLRAAMTLDAGLQRSLNMLQSRDHYNGSDGHSEHDQVWQSAIWPNLTALRKLIDGKQAQEQFEQITKQLLDHYFTQWLVLDLEKSANNASLAERVKSQQNAAMEALLETVALLSDRDFASLYGGRAIDGLQDIPLKLHVLDTALNNFVRRPSAFNRERYNSHIAQLNASLQAIQFENQKPLPVQIERWQHLHRQMAIFDTIANNLSVSENFTESYSEQQLHNLVIPEIQRLTMLLDNSVAQFVASSDDTEQRINTLAWLSPVIMITLLLLMMWLTRRYSQRGIERFIGPVKTLEEQDELKSAIGRLNDITTGSRDIDEFTRRALSEITDYSGFESGLFYVVENDQLNLHAQHAASGDHIKQRLAPNETLVGQTWQDGRWREMSCDETNLHIASASQQYRPRHDWIIPVNFEDETCAVIELASTKFKDNQQRDYLTAAARMLGASLNSLLQTQQISAALSQSQLLTEELQAQQEELRLSNEELRSNSEELQAQQEELRISNEELKSKSEALAAQQEELRVTNAELNQKSSALEKQAKDLEKAREEADQRSVQLEESSRYKSEFLANMSHELRTPLNSLLILAGSLADNDSGNLDNEEVESAQVIQESGRNLLNLINDILDLSKIEAGQMQVHLEDIAISDIGASMQRQFRHVAAEKSLTFAVESDANLPTAIHSDATKIAQILTNLIGNAIKFTHDGGVNLVISRCDSTDLLPGDTVDMVRFDVRDTGIGIPPAVQQQIFHAFQQADGSTSRQYGGTGLGLAISLNYARLLGGDIRLESTPGQGSIFSLFVPLLAPQNLTKPEIRTAPPDAPKATPTAPISPARVTDDDRDRLSADDPPLLIIEDDPHFARILVDASHRAGVQALVAHDGETGLALLEQYNVRGIMLDLSLPGIDGREVLRRIKDSPATANTPVHILSASDDLSDLPELGASSAISKPIERHQIAELLAQFSNTGKQHELEILIVEDDAGSQLAMQRLLSKMDLHAHIAKDAKECLEILATKDINLMILDLGLPDMDGVSLLQKIETANANRIPQVIIYTGRELSDNESETLQNFTGNVIIKSARSPERLSDEVALFLHSLDNSETNDNPANQHGADLDGKKVLVVDDDMRNTFALSKVLRKQGLNVVLAPSGKRALELMNDNDDIDIVLMDIMMPDMDGYQTTQAIRAQSQWSKIPVIALTAKAMPGDKEKCLAAGANDYLSKPIDIEKLKSMMQIWLSSN